MLEKSIIQFCRNLEGLRDFVEVIDGFLDEKIKEDINIDTMGFAPLVLAMAESDPEEFNLSDKQKEKLRSEFGDNISIEFEEKEGGSKGGYKINVGDEGKKRFSSALERIQKQDSRRKNLYHSSLISLVSNVECFISELIHHHYKKNPNAIGAKDKVLSLEDLKSFGSVDDAISHIIEGKVESVLRGSFDDWIKALKKDLNLSMGYIAEHRDSLLEACLRRNLLVHNNGTVNTIYLKNIPDSISDVPSVGKRLTVSSGYLEDNISNFEKCFILAASELWKKEDPKNSLRGSLLTKIAYDHLEKERWDVSGSLSFFVMGDKGLSESSRLTAQINYWQAKKWGGDFESVRKDIEDSDFSAKDQIYSFAKYLLLDKLDDAMSLIPMLLDTKTIDLDDVFSWPLLKILREEKDQEIEEICAPYQQGDEVIEELDGDSAAH